MESIQIPNGNFPFNNLILTPPINSSGGNHFMRFGLNENPLYIQTPKCKVKQCVRGTIGKPKSQSMNDDSISTKANIDTKTTNKRAFMDIVFTNENEDFIQWVENLEAYCQKFIFSKREKWFESSLEESDIENLFTSILKSVKMGKQYVLRANIPIIVSSMNIYDENENLMNLDDLKEDTNIVCILEFQGIKCSARGFQVDIEVKQILVIKPANIFDKCILSKKVPITSVTNNSSSNSVSLESSLSPSMSLEQSEPIININTSTVDEIDDSLNLQINTEEGERDGEREGQQDILEYDDITKDTSEAPEIEIETEISPSNENDLLEIDFNLEEVPAQESIVLKKRNDVYYEMYKEALKKAKMAKDLALSSYLEAKRIKNVYMLEDLSDDSDLEDFVADNEDSDEEENEDI